MKRRNKLRKLRWHVEYIQQVKAPKKEGGANWIIIKPAIQKGSSIDLEDETFRMMCDVKSEIEWTQWIKASSMFSLYLGPRNKDSLCVANDNVVSSNTPKAVFGLDRNTCSQPVMYKPRNIINNVLFTQKYIFYFFIFLVTKYIFYFGPLHLSIY